MQAQAGGGVSRTLKRVLWACAAALALAVSAWVYDNYFGYARYYYYKFRYPGSKEKSPLSKIIEESMRRRRTLEFEAEAKRVGDLIDGASHAGEDVSGLSERVEEARGLAREGKFRAARSVLNRAEMLVPLPRDFSGVFSAGAQAEPAPQGRRGRRRSRG
jgi:hypothetical protein